MILGLNVLDIVFLIIIVLSVIFGIIKGFVRELFSLAFFILALVLSFLYYSEIGEWYGENLSRNIANFAGFITIFVVILVIGSLVTYLVKKLFILGPLKSIDRIFGGVFGMVRGILLVCIIVFVFIAFQVNDKLIKESRLSPYVLETIQSVIKLAPDKFKEKKDQVVNERLGKKDS